MPPGRRCPPRRPDPGSWRARGSVRRPGRPHRRGRHRAPVPLGLGRSGARRRRPLNPLPGSAGRGDVHLRASAVSFGQPLGGLRQVTDSTPSIDEMPNPDGLPRRRKPVAKPPRAAAPVASEEALADLEAAAYEAEQAAETAAALAEPDIEETL